MREINKDKVTEQKKKNRKKRVRMTKYKRYEREVLDKHIFLNFSLD